MDIPVIQLEPPKMYHFLAIIKVYGYFFVPFRGGQGPNFFYKACQLLFLSNFITKVLLHTCACSCLGMIEKIILLQTLHGLVRRMINK